MDLQQILRVALAWARAWAVVGTLLGMLLMLGKILPFAAAGARPDSFLGHWFWVITLGLGAAAAGLGIGILHAGLMAVTEEWRESVEEAPGLVAKWGPHVLCGAAAGLIPGLLVGGLSGAIFFAFLGAGSAAAFNWRAARGT
jgi:hypothetical protein